MNYPFRFPVNYSTMFRIMVITLLVLLRNSGYGQDLSAQLKSPHNVSASRAITVRLDESTLINSNYTTFLSYSLTGNFDQAWIQILDLNEKVIQKFPINSATDGAIAVPAHLLPEGNYQLKLLVDGQIQSMHPLRVVR